MPGELRQAPEGSSQGRAESINYAFHSYLIFLPFKNEVVFQGLTEDNMRYQARGIIQRWRDMLCPADKMTSASTHQMYSTYTEPSNPEASNIQPYNEMGDLQSSFIGSEMAKLL